jgi:heat shock protein HtpX
MYLDHPRAAGMAGLFATHPSIDDRIAALVRFGGGRETVPAAPSGTPPAAPVRPGPWGEPHPWGEPRD